MGRNLPFFPVYHHRGKLSISNFAEAQKTPLRRQKQRGQGKEDYSCLSASRLTMVIVISPSARQLWSALALLGLGAFSGGASSLVLSLFGAYAVFIGGA